MTCRPGSAAFRVSVLRPDLGDNSRPCAAGRLRDVQCEPSESPPRVRGASRELPRPCTSPCGRCPSRGPRQDGDHHVGGRGAGVVPWRSRRALPIGQGPWRLLQRPAALGRRRATGVQGPPARLPHGGIPCRAARRLTCRVYWQIRFSGSNGVAGRGKQTALWVILPNWQVDGK